MISFSIISIGQVTNRVNKIIESRYDGFKIEKTFEYDENGNVYLEFEKKSFDYDTSLHFSYGSFYDYNSSNQVLRKLYRRYNPDVDLFITISQTDYTYNADGCLIEEIEIRNNLMGDTLGKIIYERDKDCRVTKETVWGEEIFSQFPSPFGILKICEREYLADGISYKEKIFRKLNNNLRRASDEIHLFNEFGKINLYYHTYFSSNQDTLYTEKKLYEYDFNRNLIYQKTQFYENVQNGWFTTIEHNYQNSYDDIGFLVEVNYEYLDHHGQSSSRTSYYEYTCDGKVNVEAISNNGSGIINSKTETFYEGEDPCFEIKDADLEVSIFPNPTSGSITIESPIFQSGNTQISVFSMDGKVLLQKREIKRCEQVSLDLGNNLPNGFYLLELSNQENHVIEKVVLSR